MKQRYKFINPYTKTVIEIYDYNVLVEKMDGYIIVPIKGIISINIDMNACDVGIETMIKDKYDWYSIYGIFVNDRELDEWKKFKSIIDSDHDRRSLLVAANDEKLIEDEQTKEKAEEKAIRAICEI